MLGFALMLNGFGCVDTRFTPEGGIPNLHLFDYLAREQRRLSGHEIFLF
jgi:hypothetical protein